MKIRVMGTEQECKLAQQYYKEFVKDISVKSYSISELYANRGSSNLYRVYVDITYKDVQQNEFSNSAKSSDRYVNKALIFKDNCALQINYNNKACTNSRVTIVAKRPGYNASSYDVVATYDNLCNMIGGPFIALPYIIPVEDLYILCNMNFYTEYFKNNIYCGKYGIIRGNIAFVKINSKGDIISLDENDVKVIKSNLPYVEF